MEELTYRAKRQLTELETAKNNNPNNKKVAEIYDQLKSIYSSTLKSLDTIRSAEERRLTEKESEISSILAGSFPYSHSSEKLHSLIREQREKLIEASSLRLETIKSTLYYVRAIKKG